MNARQAIKILQKLDPETKLFRPASDRNGVEEIKDMHLKKVNGPVGEETLAYDDAGAPGYDFLGVFVN